MPDERREGGSAPQRIEWVQEPSEGVPPDNPDWNLYSNNVVTPWDLEPDAQVEPLRGVGDGFPSTHFNGPETHEATFEYSMQQWFKTSAGETLDPAYDGMVYAADNSIRATHTVVSREEHADGGADGAGRRIYTVGKGGHPGVSTLPFETEDGTPINISLEYQFEKVRKYSVSQMAAATELVLKSTDPDDDTQTVTVEDEGAVNTEDVALDGTTLVSTSETFDDLELPELSAETVGDVVISINSGSASSPTEGTELARIPGASSYPDFYEGDLGGVALGSGSHATALTDPYIYFNGSTLDYDGTAIAPELQSGEIAVDLGLDSNSRTASQRMNVHVGEGEVTVSASVSGPNVSDEQFARHLQAIEDDIVWTAQQGGATVGTLRVTDAHNTTPGSDSKESGSAKLFMDSEWSGTGVEVTAV
jgi:hypothetical protein